MINQEIINDKKELDKMLSNSFIEDLGNEIFNCFLFEEKFKGLRGGIIFLKEFKNKIYVSDILKNKANKLEECIKSLLIELGLSYFPIESGPRYECKARWLEPDKREEIINKNLKLFDEFKENFEDFIDAFKNIYRENNIMLNNYNITAHNSNVAIGNNNQQQMANNDAEIIAKFIEAINRQDLPQEKKNILIQWVKDNSCNLVQIGLGIIGLI